MNKLEELASRRPEAFMAKLVELGWTENDAIRAAKLWARQQRMQEKLISTEDYKKKQTEWFEFLQERALSKQWCDIHRKTPVWCPWIFPRELDVCAKLGEDCEYMRNFGLCVYIVFESWGWDPINSWDIVHAWPEQKWRGDEIDEDLLIAMIRSCNAFGKKSLTRLCSKFIEGPGVVPLSRQTLKTAKELFGSGFLQIP